MHLSHLSLTNFRAFTRLDMDLPGRILLLVGDNAQGKTSLLEAVYYLATFSSFHAQNDRQLINFVAGQSAQAVTRLVADYQVDTHKHRLEVRLILEAVGANGTRLRKEILVDGVKRSANEALGKFTAVILLPQMTHILEGGPEERRRYLNLAISQAIPGYAQALADYTQAITQRNALLKQLNERGGDPGQLAYWDEMVASRGAVLIYNRIHAIEELERLAARTHDRLTHGAEVLRLVYHPSFDPLPMPEGQYTLPMQTTLQRTSLGVEKIRQGFLQRLSEIRGEEIARGVTTIGPHRDEIRFLGNAIDLGDFGSRGQVRTTLLSLKLAEVDWLKEKTGHWPVLLLDETLAELDLQRRADLLEYLSHCEQALLTTTDLHLFSEEFVAQSKVCRVESGIVSLE
ncbi:DNA replication and repair protein RecF [Longilinea arvoryzae]|uniref:DNA replication and repair protein RecF n=2 Tax=Longilinea arvoryzae TaxID=360412 RepID=A0A0S7BC90_9CHLR|nr:DNA replication and repair protein RecF [Longilinea arvoryzae]